MSAVRDCGWRSGESVNPEGTSCEPREYEGGAARGAQTAVFFDGSCPLCRSEIGLYRGRDRAAKLRFVDISSPGVEMPDVLTRGAAMARLHVLSRDDRLLSGAAAFAELWSQVPGWRWAGRLASLPGVTPLLEASYRLFLLLRPALVRLFLAARGIRAGTRPLAP
ncbi:MAG: DUF393 domain-containing protein [Proteobacteria bacterium]|nr:DUF393 domain-containing protein [Pseudomonadota bacterium]